MFTKIVSLFALLIMFCIPAFAEDGKVFIKTEPAGADVALVVDGAQKALDKKTAALVQVPQGQQSFILTLAGYKPAMLKVDVKGTGITKPDIVALEKLTVETDIVFDEGWAVYIDKQPAKDKDSKPAITPCTLNLAAGSREITLVKDGFADIIQKAEIKENGAVEIKGKALKGVSALTKKEIAKPSTPSVIVDLSKLDFDKLTKEQWDAIKGFEFVVEANDPLDTKIDIAAGDQYLVIPWKGDRWLEDKTNPNCPDANWKGKVAMYKGHPLMALCFKIGDGKKITPVSKVPMQDAGRLYLLPNGDNYDVNKGSIRVKILKLR